MSYVYAIGDESGFVKFGRSKSAVGRLSELQTGNRERLTLLAAVEVDDAAEFERHVHGCLDQLGARVRGEWFAASVFTTMIVNAIGTEPFSDSAQVAMDLACFCAPDNAWFWSVPMEHRDDARRAALISGLWR